MNESRMRDALLGAERPSADLERRYRERLQAIAERRLTGADRAGHALGLVVALLAVARVIQLFAQGRAAGRAEALAGLAVALVFSLGWAVASFVVLRSGVDRVFSNVEARTRLVVAFTFLLAGLMLWAGLESADAARGVRLILFGLVFWCAIGLPFLIAQLVRRAEVRVRADMLRLELSLAERDAASGTRP